MMNALHISRRNRLFRGISSIALVAGLLLVACEVARAQVERIQVGRLRVELERVIDVAGAGPNVLLNMATAGDDSGRLFFAEKSGRVRMFQNGTFSTFLDLTGEVLATSERGLLGLAFHPGYADSLSPGFRKFYTYHSVPTNLSAPVDFTSNVSTVSHHNLVTEWQVSAGNPNQIDVSTRREVFREAHISDIHNAGTITFGPDGYLYGSIGAAPAGSAQQLTAQNNTDIMGTIYRIDPLHPSLTPTSGDAVSVNGKYRVPASNPFVVDNSNPAALDEIFAYGLRNPYRFSVDSDTGLVFAGDVGQGAREEINVVPLGGNLGWPYYEGSTGGTVTPPNPAPTTVMPFGEYTHSDGSAAIGGYVYRGSIPALQGKYIFGEFSWGAGFNASSGRLLWTDPFDDLGNLKDPSEVVIQELSRGDSCDQSFNSLCTLDITLYSLGVDDDGELYAMGFKGGSGAKLVAYKFTDAYFIPPGDYNEDRTVDDADYAVWRSAFGSLPGGTQVRRGYGADGNGDGLIDAADYLVFRKHFGQTTGPGAGASATPEPATFLPVVLGILGIACSAHCRRSRGTGASKT